MNQVATQQNKPPTLRDQIAKMGGEFAKALPASVTADKFVRTAQTAIAMTRNIEKVTNPQSLLSACVKAATDGLILDGREAALIVDYQGNVQYRPMWEGLKELAFRSGMVKLITTRVVHDADYFEFFMGDEEKIVHRIDIRAPRGKPIAVYCVIQLVTGGVIREVMTVDQINAIRERSDGWRAFAAGKIKSTPWSTDWDEMARKTVFRRAQKLLPRSPELERLHTAAERIDEDYQHTGEAGPAQQPIKARGAASALLRDVTPAQPQKQPQGQQDDDRGAISRGDDFDRETGEIIDQQPMQQPVRQQAKDMDPI